MKSLSIAILLCVTIANRMFAVSAFPQRIPVVVNGDTIYIQLKGDECCKYAIDEAGYTVLPTDHGWYYAKEDIDGNVILSDIPLSSCRTEDERATQFFKKIRKGICPKRMAAVGSSVCRATDNGRSYSAAIGYRRALVILMQFQDKFFTKYSSDFQRLFNEEYYQEDGAIGSVRDYYKWASYGQLDLHSDVMGPYTSKYMMSYYGGNAGVSGGDKNPYALFEEALQHVIADVNLSDYDADGDGYVDNIHIIYAGYGEEAGASANAIWAHEMTFRTINAQGMKIDRYSCAPELRGNKGSGISRIGPHCHEIGHALGAMDYYDTDYETGGKYDGTGQWDIMASGSWNNEGISPADFNPYVKVYNFGWTEAKTLVKDADNVIGVSSEEGNIYRLNTGTNNDFFLIENRKQEYFNSAEPGNGLLIFHIGPNLEARASTNTINSTYPQQCYVICASSSYAKPTSSSKSYGNINSSGCPYPGVSGNTEFSDTSVPAALTISGSETGISISNIRLEGQNIVLYCGNANSSEQDDSVVDEVYLWGEDFEQLRLPSGWNYTDVVGIGNLEVVSKFSDSDSPQSPKAESGQGYAKFSAMTQTVIGSYRTIGVLTSPRIKLADGHNYVLTFSVRSYNKKIPNDTISVVFYGDQMNKEYCLVKKTVQSIDSWERLSVDLPGEYNMFTLEFVCNVEFSSILFIDNIRISEQSEETGVKDCGIVTHSIGGCKIFNLSGQCLLSPIKGINIINGKKLLVR